MNERYNRYIEYIVNDIQAPYFKNMRDSYGLSPDEYESTLSKIFNQPIRHINSIIDRTVYNNRGDIIYFENSNGEWKKWEYDEQGNNIYFERSNGRWYRKEYDDQGNRIYYEDSEGEIEDYR